MHHQDQSMEFTRNERGGVHLHTLVDRERKRSKNGDDVVVRLHDPTDHSTERTAPPRSAHVQLDDVPRTPIQPSVEGEFRQHDSVVTMMMFYRRRASPKLYNDRTEVEYLEGAPDTAKQSTCVSMGCPPPPYIKEWRRVGLALSMARPRGSPTPSGSRIPPSLG